MATVSDQPIVLEVPKNSNLFEDRLDDQGRSWLLLGLTEEMHFQIEELASRTGDTKANLINKALGLYKAISDASREGKHVGIATADQELETEYVGF